MQCASGEQGGHVIAPPLERKSLSTGVGVQGASGAPGCQVMSWYLSWEGKTLVLVECRELTGCRVVVGCRELGHGTASPIEGESMGAGGIQGAGTCCGTTRAREELRCWWGAGGQRCYNAHSTMGSFVPSQAALLPAPLPMHILGVCSEAFFVSACALDKRKCKQPQTCTRPFLLHLYLQKNLSCTRNWEAASRGEGME